MKSISILMLTLFTLSGMSQTYSFKPNWENGTVKTIEMSTSTKEYENGEVISDTTTFNQAKITVTKDLKANYEVEVLFENQVLTAAKEFYDKIGEELGEFSAIKIKLSVSKETGEVSVLNPKEVKDFYMKGFDQITELMEEKVPEMAPFMKLALSPINKMFESKENLEAYAKEMVGFVFVPFEHEYTLNIPPKTNCTY